MPGHLLGGEQRQLDDVAADLLAQARVLGLELLAVLLQPLLQIRVAPPARACSSWRWAWRRDSSRIFSRSAFASSRSLLHELAELPGLFARLVGLVERLADPVAALVDHPLDASEGEAPEHPEDDQEREDRPDHQARDDVDERALVLLGRRGRLLGEEERLQQVVSHDEHEGEQAAEERVEDDGLGEREAEPLDAGQLAAKLGLPRHRLDHGAEDRADADAGADGAEPDPDPEGDRLAEVRPGPSSVVCASKSSTVPPP